MQGAVLSCGEEPAPTPGAESDLSFSREAAPVHPSKRVLVLNRNWQAVGIVGVKRAFLLLFREDARVISTAKDAHALLDIAQWLELSARHPPAPEEETLATVRFPVRIPSVLILSDYDRLPMCEVHLSREGILSRDECTCQYCGQRYPESELTIDHVIPRERGGRSTWENLVTACRDCNERKANRLPHEAGMRLTRRPRRPPRIPFAAAAVREGRFEAAWREFLPVA